MEKDLQKYVETFLTTELKEILNSNRHKNTSELNEFEKAIIYNYSDIGYESLNETLRDGKDLPEFGKYLNYALKKLPDYKLICYRSIRVSKSKLQEYYDAFTNNSIIIEKSFLSCSKSRLVASGFSSSPLFIISSKRGKEIEKIAKFGIDTGENEKEVLFMSGSKFKVMDITEEADKTIRITLEEV